LIERKEGKLLDKIVDHQKYEVTAGFGGGSFRKGHKVVVMAVRDKTVWLKNLITGYFGGVGFKKAKKSLSLPQGQAEKKPPRPDFEELAKSDGKFRAAADNTYDE